MTMNLDLGSDSVEYVAWKAQEKKWYVDGEECPISAFLIDADSIKLGQGKLAAGVSPEWIWNESPGQKQDIQEGFKKAFYLKIYMSKKHGSSVTEWREWMTTQRASRDALMLLWNSVDKLERGKLMKVNVKGSKATKMGEATVNVPVITFDSWVDRPADKVVEEPKDPVDKILSDDLEDEIDWG
jgi:hypothetical protein|tara:strand:+ start:1295 stop:1846 length:552 start_codon:yes stop_codon:yes gene_type:complete